MLGEGWVNAFTIQGSFRKWSLSSTRSRWLTTEVGQCRPSRCLAASSAWSINKVLAIFVQAQGISGEEEMWDRMRTFFFPWVLSSVEHFSTFILFSLHSRVRVFIDSCGKAKLTRKDTLRHHSFTLGEVRMCSQN